MLKNYKCDSSVAHQLLSESLHNFFRGEIHVCLFPELLFSTFAMILTFGLKVKLKECFTKMCCIPFLSEMDLDQTCQKALSGMRPGLEENI